jgi:phosphohistidine swiveling domain-containing protein
MKLKYIQRKSKVASILWILGNGLCMAHYAVKKVYFGNNIGNMVWLCRNGEVFACADETTDIEGMVSKVQNKILKNPDHVLKISQIFKQRSKEVKKLIQHLRSHDFTKDSNLELLNIYKEIVDAYKDVYTYGEQMVLAVGDLADVIKPYFLEKGINEDDYNILISDFNLSFVQRERRDLLKIALASGENINKNIKNQIKKHAEKYAWIPYDYGVTSFSEEHFLNELKKISAKGRVSLQAELDHLQLYSNSIKKRQKEMGNKINIDNLHKKLLAAVRICFFLLDYKKELFTQIHWYSLRLFKEISARLEIEQILAQYSFPSEMENYLKGKNKPDRESLQSRYENLVMIIKPSGEITNIEGEKAKKIIDKFLSERDNDSVGETLVGRPASFGFVKGRVRIILDASRCDTFKHGEILVTTMSSPDYMIAVRKAAAIVTDEGGVICHAAIISRELGIPCVIGTKFATKVLKDGDLVEVDANKGIVRKI